MNKPFRVIDNIDEYNQQKIQDHANKKKYDEIYATIKYHCKNCSGIMNDNHSMFCDLNCFQEFINRKK